jgi:hypothetical protein
MEFFNLEELSANIYTYRHDFNEKNGRFFRIDYLLFTVQVVQPLQPTNVLKSIKRVVEPTIISLNNGGNVQSKTPGHLLKSSKEQRRTSVAKTDIKRILSVIKRDDKDISPEQRNVSRENTIITTGETQILSWDRFSDESRVIFLSQENINKFYFIIGKSYPSTYCIS